MYGPRNGASNPCLLHIPPPAEELQTSSTINSLSSFRDLFLNNTGRFITCDIKINERLITLAAIYAPNEDDPGFFERFHDHLRDFQCDDIIIGGGFNLVLDIDIDKKGGLAKTHTKAVKVIKSGCQ